MSENSSTGLNAGEQAEVESLQSEQEKLENPKLKNKLKKHKKGHGGQEMLSDILESVELDNKDYNSLYTHDEWMDREVRRLDRSKCCLLEIVEVYSKLTDPLGARKQLIELIECQSNVTADTLTDVDAIINDAAIQNTEKVGERHVHTDEDGAEADDEMDYEATKDAITEKSDSSEIGAAAGVEHQGGHGEDIVSFPEGDLSVAPSSFMDDQATGQGDGPMDTSGQRRISGLRKKFRLFQLTVELLKQAAWGPFLRIAWPRVLDQSGRRHRLLQSVRAQVKDITPEDTRVITIAPLVTRDYISNKNFDVVKQPSIKVWTQTAESGSVVIMEGQQSKVWDIDETNSYKTLENKIFDTNETRDTFRLNTNRSVDSSNKAGTMKTFDINKSDTGQTIDLNQPGTGETSDINKLMYATKTLSVDTSGENKVDKINTSDKTVDINELETNKSPDINITGHDKSLDYGRKSDASKTLFADQSNRFSNTQRIGTSLSGIRSSIFGSRGSEKRIGGKSKDDYSADDKEKKIESDDAQSSHSDSDEEFEIRNIPLDSDGNPLGKSTGICHYCGAEILPLPTPYQRFKAWNPNQFYCCERYRVMFEELEAIEMSRMKTTEPERINIAPHGPYSRKTKIFPGFEPYKKFKIIPGCGFFNDSDFKKKKNKDRRSTDSLVHDLILPELGTRDGGGSISKTITPSVSEHPTMAASKASGERLKQVGSSVSENKSPSKKMSGRQSSGRVSSFVPRPSGRERSSSWDGSEIASISGKEKEHKGKKKRGMLSRATAKSKATAHHVATDTSDLNWDPYEIRFGHPRFFPEGEYYDAISHCYRHAMIVMTQTELYDVIKTAHLSGPGK